MQSLIITGGAGFIGCNFTRLVLEKWRGIVVIFDKLTYAGSPLNLEQVQNVPNYQFVRGDIADGMDVRQLFEKFPPRYIVNFAAESHVDRSIDSPMEFIRTNVNGTFVLLEAALAYYRTLSVDAQKEFRFLHVSTDEVYGTLGAEGVDEILQMANISMAKALLC